MTAFQGLIIAEITGRVAGEYAAKLLADLGASVIKVEPPDGSPTRRIGPFKDGKSTLFGHLNTNKKSVVLDLEDTADHVLLDGLLTKADGLIMDHTPQWMSTHGLDKQRVAARYPQLVHVCVTPFGQSAPPEWQNMRAINVMNAGGWAYHTPSETAPDLPPLKGAGRYMSEIEGALEAAIAAAASLWRQRKTGQGQFVDISEVAAQLSRTDTVLGRVLAGDDNPGPERTVYDMGGPGSSFPTLDGFVFLLMTTKAHWNGLLNIMGQPEWTKQLRDDWLEFDCTRENVAYFRKYFTGWTQAQLKHEISDAAQKAGCPLVPMNTAEDLPTHPQYQHRGYFQILDGVSYPTAGYKLSASPVSISSHAPDLGADQRELAR